MKRKYMFIHCTATRQGNDYSSGEVMSWFYKRGWKNPGYHDLIHLDGSWSSLRAWDFDDEIELWEIVNGARGWNNVSHHVAYIGGVDRFDWTRPKDTRTPEQIDSFKIYIDMILKRFPDIQIGGHNQISTKACPSFDVEKFLESIDIPEKNIFRQSTVRPSEMNSENGLFDFRHDWTSEIQNEKLI